LIYLSILAFGTLAPLGQASKFFTLLRLNRRWTSFSAYAVVCPNVDLRRFYGLPLPPASTPTACLHHIIVNIVIVIVIVHFLFKRNIYLSLYVILYVFLLS
jgi:hypothetical protein